MDSLPFGFLSDSLLSQMYRLLGLSRHSLGLYRPYTIGRAKQNCINTKLLPKPRREGSIGHHVL